MAKGVARLAQLSKKLRAPRPARRTAARDRTRSVRRRAHDVAAWLRWRNDDAKEEVKAMTAEMVIIAEAAAAGARHLATNARRAGQAASGTAVVAELERTAEAVERITAQNPSATGSDVPDGASRGVSLHDPTPGPSSGGGSADRWSSATRRRSSTTPTASWSTTPSWSATPDAPMLVQAPVRIVARFSKVPRAVTADRGYGEACVDAALGAGGVKVVAILRRDRPGAEVAVRVRARPQRHQD